MNVRIERKLYIIVDIYLLFAIQCNHVINARNLSVSVDTISTYTSIDGDSHSNSSIYTIHSVYAPEIRIFRHSGTDDVLVTILCYYSISCAPSIRQPQRIVLIQYNFAFFFSSSRVYKHILLLFLPVFFSSHIFHFIFFLSFSFQFCCFCLPAWLPVILPLLLSHFSPYFYIFI